MGRVIQEANNKKKKEESVTRFDLGSEIGGPWAVPWVTTVQPRPCLSLANAP